MKRLTLLRHAEAETALGGQPDWERALTPRGIMNATEMAQRFRSRRLKPDLILASNAQRAHTTAAIFAKELRLLASQIHSEEQLYLASPKQLFNTITTLTPDAKHVLIVGHNPGICECADQLSKDRRISAMPTCSIFTAKFTCANWCDLQWGTGIEVEFDYL